MTRLGSRGRSGNDGVNGRLANDRLARTIWVGLLVFLGLYLIGGGSNLPTAAPLVVLRPASILLIALCLAVPSRERTKTWRVPLLLLAAFTATIALQLIPLPPSLWAQLPGHVPLANLVAAVGGGGVWRPISLTPTVTLSSLLATLTGWAVAMAFIRLSDPRRRALADVVIAMTLASCLVGLLQLIGGDSSIFYFYKSDKTITGLLANRNHQAALLAATLPLLRVWMAGGAPGAQVWRSLAAGLMGMLILGMILLTGSRSGLVLALIGTIAAYTIAPIFWIRGTVKGRGPSTGRSAAVAALARWSALVLPVLLVGAAIATGRDLSIQRLTNADFSGEERLRNLPTTLSLVKDYFPFGSGFGSFDAVFRIHEPDNLLKATFFNRAHNDYIETAITGGLLPVIVLAAFLAWAGSMAWRVSWRSWREPGVLHARAGASMLLIFAVASLSDYSLRPPLMSAVAVIAVCWLARGGTRFETGKAADF